MLYIINSPTTIHTLEALIVNESIPFAKLSDCSNAFVLKSIADISGIFNRLDFNWSNLTDLLIYTKKASLNGFSSSLTATPNSFTAAFNAISLDSYLTDETPGNSTNFLESSFLVFSSKSFK